MTGESSDRPSISRRSALLAGVAGILGAAGCAKAGEPKASVRPASPTPTPSTSSSPTARPQLARFVVSGPRTGKAVALTFHGSEDPAVAERLLVLAERARVPLTIFAVGTWLEAYPEMAQRILRGGHDLGNHTYSHPHASQLTEQRIRGEIWRCRALLLKLTGTPGVGLRVPEVSVPSRTVLAEAATNGYPLVIGFDIDPHDYEDPPSDQIARRVLAQVRPGSIVSLHTGHDNTVDAMPEILRGLQQRGLVPVGIRRLLSL